MLIRYEDVDEAAYLDYMTEWERSGEMIVPSATKRMGRSFVQMLEAWKVGETEIAYERGYVPATLYFLIDDRRRILGAIHFRHKLNERMMVNGGNIGYGVRPSERRKGYASKMLGLLLALLKSEGVGKVLLTCDEDNLGSIKTIERHDAILEDKVLFEGTWTRRYWILI